MLTIVASMDYELAGLRKEQRRGGLLAINGTRVRLEVIGVGKDNAQVSAESLLRDSRRNLGGGDESEAWLLLGFAGAVDPSLETGDLLMASKYYRANPGDGADYLCPDQQLWDRAVSAAEGNNRVSCQDSLTVDRLVGGRPAKQTIRGQYPVGSVNMEDYWVAEAARQAGVAFLSIRVVLDNARQALPGYLPSLAGSRLKAGLVLATTPWRIPGLVRLARQLPLAQGTLARFASGFAAQMALTDGAVGQPDLVLSEPWAPAPAFRRLSE